MLKLSVAANGQHVTIRFVKHPQFVVRIFSVARDGQNSAQIEFKLRGAIRGVNRGALQDLSLEPCKRHGNSPKGTRTGRVSFSIYVDCPVRYPKPQPPASFYADASFRRQFANLNGLRIRWVWFANLKNRVAKAHRNVELTIPLQSPARFPSQLINTFAHDIHSAYIIRSDANLNSNQESKCSTTNPP